MNKYLLSAAAFLMFFTINVSAQTVPQTDEEFDLMQRAQMVAEIKSLRVQNTAKDTIIVEQKGSIETYKRLDTVQESRIADLKEAIKARTEANQIDLKVENLYKDQITDYRTETNRLRDENAKLRKSRDRRGLLFGVAGLIGGALAF